MISFRVELGNCTYQFSNEEFEYSLKGRAHRVFVEGLKDVKIPESPLVVSILASYGEPSKTIIVMGSETLELGHDYLKLTEVSNKRNHYFLRNVVELPKIVSVVKAFFVRGGLSVRHCHMRIAGEVE